MKRYISATTKTYNKDQLVASINYLFDYAVEQAGVSPEDVKITKIEIDKNTKPVYYTARVSYTYCNLSPEYGVYLTPIPTDHDIPEDYWVTTRSGKYVEELTYELDTSKFDDAKQAYTTFCNTVNVISSRYGLTYAIGKQFPSKLRLDDTYVIFHASLTAAEIDDPNMKFEISAHHGWTTSVVVDKVSGDFETNVCSRDLSCTYHLDTHEFEVSYRRRHSDVNVLLSEDLKDIRALIDRAVLRLKNADIYEDQVKAVASMIDDAIPEIVTIDYSQNIDNDYSPWALFNLSGSFGNVDVHVDNVFDLSDVEFKRIIKNLKAKIRRSRAKQAKQSSTNYDKYRSRSETLHEAE